MTHRRIIAVAVLAVWGTGLSIAHSAMAATVTASYVSGYPDVLINGYRTEAMGTFTLRDGDRDRTALCIEAHEPHSTRQDAYGLVTNQVISAELDTLLWLTEQARPDADTALAAASLAWFYSNAQRTIGVPVWADGTRSFAPIGPLSPEPWDELPAFGLSHPIGLRTGYEDLDHVERRVAELHRTVLAHLGPWRLDVDGDRGFILTGPAGPISNQPVEVTVATAAGTDSWFADTDGAGRVAVSTAGFADGAVFSARVFGPGVHQEWDGTGAIQRMSTATTAEVTAQFNVAPLHRHVLVQKRSSDPTIGVEGARFELRDANAIAVETVTSDADGSARFAPIDPAVHPEPYRVVEVAAPPGLVPVDDPIVVESTSSEPAHPTIVEVINAPQLVPVSVRKQLSVEPAGPSDRSGFEFTIERAEGALTHVVTTRSVGVTDPVPLPIGTYTVCERAVPPWAIGLIDGGCVTFTIGLATLAEVDDGSQIAIDYVNHVPVPLIETHASDASDGDQTLPETGGIVNDLVTMSNLTPGTTYTVRGALVESANGTSVAETERTFIAEANTMELTLQFPLDDPTPGEYVVIEYLLVGDAIAAQHIDLTNEQQTVAVLPPPTTTTSTVAPSTTTSSTTTTSTTTTTIVADSTTTTTTSVPATVPPTPTTAVHVVQRPTVPQPTLPRTGSDAAATMLRVADLGFVAGVGFVALGAFLPRRRQTDG